MRVLILSYIFSLIKGYGKGGGKTKTGSFENLFNVMTIFDQAYRCKNK